MGFYNIGYIIKNILYNFRKSLKYIVLILLIILIFYVLLLPEVKAAALSSTAYSSSDIESIMSCYDLVKEDYDCFYASIGPGNYHGLTILTAFNPVPRFKI